MDGPRESDGRRAFLAAAGSLVAGSSALTGCTSLVGSGGDGGGDGGDGGSTQPDGDGPTGNGDTTADPGTATATAATSTAADGDTTGTTASTATASTTRTTMATPTGTPVPILTRTIEVEEDEWSRHTWAQSGEATLDYEFEVTDGPAIDVLVMTLGQFELFRQGQSADYLPAASAPDSTGARIRATLEPPEERYILVFDNTYFGPSGPPRNAIDDTATVDVDATVYR